MTGSLGVPATTEPAPTLRPASDQPCWYIDSDSDWETAHYPTLEALEAWRTKSNAYLGEEVRETGEARQESAPCWVRSCTEPGCDAMDDGDGECTHVHYTPDDKPDDDYLCPEHAPEPEWLTRVKAENAKGPRPWADVAADMADEPLTPGDVARLRGWANAAGRDDNDDNRTRRLVGRLLNERDQLRREYIANSSTIAELRQLTEVPL